MRFSHAAGTRSAAERTLQCRRVARPYMGERLAPRAARRLLLSALRALHRLTSGSGCDEWWTCGRSPQLPCAETTPLTATACVPVRAPLPRAFSTPPHVGSAVPLPPPAPSARAPWRLCALLAPWPLRFGEEERPKVCACKCACECVCARAYVLVRVRVRVRVCICAHGESSLLVLGDLR